MRAQFQLQQDVTFLNHGSYGACLHDVTEHQIEMIRSLERQPVKFFNKFLLPMLEDVRQVLGDFLGCSPSNLGFVRNATSGVNSILRQYPFDKGDEMVVTNHGYRACAYASSAVCKDKEVAIKVAEIPFPLKDHHQIMTSIQKCFSNKTKLLMVDHVSSPTGLIFPIKEIIELAHEHQITVIVDGAHAPGMLPLELEGLGADFYVGNCHKWLAAAKSSGFIFMDKRHHCHFRGEVISHAQDWDSTAPFFQRDGDWPGTWDPSSVLTIPTAISSMRSLFGSWDALREHNSSLVAAATDLLTSQLGVSRLAPQYMFGSMVPLPLPLPSSSFDTAQLGSIKDRLLDEFMIEVPLYLSPNESFSVFRISGQAYNVLEDYKRLAEAFQAILPKA